MIRVMSAMYLHRHTFPNNTLMKVNLPTLLMKAEAEPMSCMELILIRCWSFAWRGLEPFALGAERDASEPWLGCAPDSEGTSGGGPLDIDAIEPLDASCIAESGFLMRSLGD